MNEFELIERLIKLIKEYNDNSKKIKNIDPLFECSYQININYPFIGKNKKDKVQGINIILKMIYSSSGIEESTYIINDIFSFTLTDNKIINIKKEIESFDPVKINDLELSIAGNDILFRYIEEFFNRVLPRSC